ncbi:MULTISPECIES: DUF5343 domain-containing protein [Pseudomonadota]|uniref:DUF5343 domain-containing protein n=1 Tax=Pseudomonadota TaxID=1224 RepID=UPI001CA740A7|nr:MULTISPECIES: DUF5343 domain-containing protein [Pseudomonadota]MBY8965202.1 DUF5343 domain-containing protein [Algiphilus acroporae]MCI5070506.1 DUF5343 domain-containing protein [Acidovorax sp.]MCI5103635.1 DUF5343 domain-containing protein [Algiphilus sp.]
MAHPYISGPGNIATMVRNLRKSFPKSVTSETVKKYGLAPNNESYLINALQFIGLLDDDGNKTEAATKAFSNHKDEAFQKAFADLIKDAYSDLFDLYGDQAWALEIDDLITFFRSSDQTSDAIGRRQANTFKVFAGLAGQADLPEPRLKKTKSESSKNASPKKNSTATRNKAPSTSTSGGGAGSVVSTEKQLGLTVRIEINLPADGDKETYDNIFKSIRENLIDS